jgi:hypothetical protein
MIRDPSDGTGVDHLAETFAMASRSFPEIMEPYQVMLADADSSSQAEIMREGLRSTFRKRFPGRRFLSDTDQSGSGLG